MCGCGQRTRLSTRNRPDLGHVKGQPLTYVNGHNARGTGQWRISVEDRGFETACHIWLGSKDLRGYGQASNDGQVEPTHRIAYARVHGPVPAGMDIDHLCRIPSCCNPAHLEAVTHAENNRRGAGTKLTKSQALAVRAGERPHREIAMAYGISQRTVRSIKNGETWVTDMEAAA
jgi:hypothetical protein